MPAFDGAAAERTFGSGSATEGGAPRHRRSEGRPTNERERGRLRSSLPLYPHRTQNLRSFPVNVHVRRAAGWPAPVSRGVGTPVACCSLMEALSSLVREHRFITRLVSALEAYALRVRAGADVEPAHLRDFARAIREYADELHREKEEHVLLPFLVRHGFDWEAPPLARVCDEHSLERDLIAALAHAGARLERWSDEERRHVTGLVSALGALQREHHRTENEELFPAVNARLDAAAQQQLHDELERFDERPTHAVRRAAACDLGEELIACYSALDGAGP